MIFILLITAIFVVLSVYFYLKTESLQRDLLHARRSLRVSEKENQTYLETLSLIAQRNEEFAKKRLKELSAQQANKDLKTIYPLITNYSIIFQECLKGSGNLQKITRKCYESTEEGSYKSFSNYIARQEKHIKQMWQKNNLSGFTSLVEACLLQQESTQQIKAMVES